MRQGRISYSKIRALTRVATPDNEQDLLDFALAGTASHVERLVRAWRRVDRIEEREQEALRHASRYLNLWTDDDGMVVVRGRLDPEAGVALIKAVEAGCDVLYDEEKERETADQDGVPPGQRRADAMGRVAEAALAGGLDKGTRGDRYQVVVHVDAAVLEEAAVADVPAGTPEEKGDRFRFPNAGIPPGTKGPRNRYLSPFSGHETRKAEIPAHSAVACRGNVPAGTSQENPGGPGSSDFEGGAHVPAETSQRIACDAGKVVMTQDSEGNILDIGRKTRIISPALRRALTHRDQGCRFPGCGVRFCEAHHVRHWARGGETRLGNLVLLCRRHHRCVHEEGWRIQVGAEGQFQFLRPDGGPVPQSPPPLLAGDEPLAALLESVVEAGVAVGQMPGYPEWDGSRLDLGWAVECLRSTEPAT